ncbi:MAG: restriction endonuclease [Terrisporobacter othiniensis]|uniref:restriction endonuclease n=1 Tax=Terrisporobacter petrolearius TaxID=1460447 RepID=UPI0022E5F71E|nr:restriction endonuclease [Terrisporobacter petrolearius]MDU4861719.1 restriction endonuclease [Terrisporobacter othiniensis]MDU6995372.1 restriction endonuclease [Terrisporobacter othiniensis]
MHWEEFEHLIRELFEKEYAKDNVEVNVTQDIKDVGVIVDSDPIKGGKIILQAKRYTNIVGISAIRELATIVSDEGAMKGTLVTTADSGRDSYEYIKDKPLTLINGENLLYMLKKHGYEA